VFDYFALLGITQSTFPLLKIDDNCRVAPNLHGEIKSSAFNYFIFSKSHILFNPT